VIVLDLFSGLNGWSEPWKEAGHEVITLDIEPSFGADLRMDIVEFAKDPKGYIAYGPENGWGLPVDVVLASPPCESFSVMTIGRNWTVDHIPKTERAVKAVEWVKATLEVIDILRPAYWVMENPRAKLRKLDFMQPYGRRTVTYCRLGERFMKPTDLWGGFPPSLMLPEMCKNGNPDHISAARGSKTGTQTSVLTPAMRERLEKMGPKTTRTKFQGGMISDMSRFPSWSPERTQLSALRAKIPEQLARMVMEAAVMDFRPSYERGEWDSTVLEWRPVSDERRASDE